MHTTHPSSFQYHMVGTADHHSMAPPDGSVHLWESHLLPEVAKIQDLYQHSRAMIMILCHELSDILQCPVSGALSLGRNHHCCNSSGYIYSTQHKEHCDYDEKREVLDNHQTSSRHRYAALALHSTLIWHLVRIIWQTQIVCCSSFELERCPCSSASIE